METDQVDDRGIGALGFRPDRAARRVMRDDPERAPPAGRPRDHPGPEARCQRLDQHPRDPVRQADAGLRQITEAVGLIEEHDLDRLATTAHTVTLRVTDDGTGLPKDFQPGRSKSLGLKIVQTVVTSDLKGVFYLHNRTDGVRGAMAEVILPRV